MNFAKKMIPGLLMISLLAYCKADTSVPDGNGDSVNLSNELLTPGNVVDLPATGGKTVAGKVVDIDEDNIGDGVDLSGSGTPEMVYLSGDVSGSSGAQLRQAAGLDYLACYLAGNPEWVYYFVPGDDGKIALSDDPADPKKAKIKFVLNEDGSLAGLDSTGDGQADDTTLAGLKPSLEEPELLTEFPYLELAEVLIPEVINGDLYLLYAARNAHIDETTVERYELTTEDPDTGGTKQLGVFVAKKDGRVSVSFETELNPDKADDVRAFGKISAKAGSAASDPLTDVNGVVSYDGPGVEQVIQSIGQTGSNFSYGFIHYTANYGELTYGEDPGKPGSPLITTTVTADTNEAKSRVIVDGALFVPGLFDGSVNATGVVCHYGFGDTTQCDIPQ